MINWTFKILVARSSLLIKAISSLRHKTGGQVIFNNNDVIPYFNQ